MAKRILAIVLVFALLMPNFLVPSVYAASSPWSETNWSTQTGTNVDTTTTAGDITLSKQEKFSNTGFETDLTSWTSSAASFNDASFAAASGAVASWPLDDTTTTQSYARVVNPAVSTGRDVVINGGFDADATWTKSTGATISGGVGVFTSVGSDNGFTQSSLLVLGKAYTVTFTVSGYSSGGVRVYVGSGASGTARTANGTYTQTLIASGDTVFRVYATAVGTTLNVDGVTVTQLSIPATPVVAASELLTDGNMETSGTSSWTALNGATLSKQTGTPHNGSQVIRVARNASGPPGATQTILSIGQTYRVTGYGRSDGGVATPVVRHGSTNIFSGTTSTSWQPFDAVFVATATDFQLDAGNTVTTSQYVEYDDVTVTLDTSIRQGEIVQDGDMETSGTAVWTANNTATLTKNTTSPHGGSNIIRVARNGSNQPNASQAVLVIGKTYRFTGYARSGSTTDSSPRVYNSGTTLTTGNSTDTTTWQFFDVTFLATGTGLGIGTSTSTGTNFVDWDDISVSEVDPLVGVNTNGVIPGSTASGHLQTGYTFDGSNDVVNIYSSDLNSVFNQSEGTLVVWAKVSGSGVWTDGVERRIAVLLSDSSNQMHIRKSSASNRVDLTFTSGGTQKQISLTSFSPTTWQQYAITWSASNDQFKAYLNGAQSGATSTGLGTWTGNLSSTQTVIGNLNSSGTTNPWSGMINDVRLYSRALSASEISNLYSGLVSTRDTTTKLVGTASAKLVAQEGYNGSFVQSVNVGNTETYQLEANAYTDGSAVTSSDLELFYNGSAVTTTYTAVGGGWYKLTGSVTGAASARDYGVVVKAGKTAYLDTMSLWNYPTSGTLTSSIFDSEQAPDWGTLTYSATTPTNTTASVAVRSSNSASMTSATAFASCTAVTSGSDISSNGCVTDTNRYLQYQVTLATTNQLATPTFTDITTTFAGTAVVTTLDSPGDNTYTNSERPLFRFLAGSSASSAVSSYTIEIDNGESGDFTIENIPANRTGEYDTPKYKAIYEGFSDSDSNNNYISVYTKSSNEWGNDHNDGTLKEGKRTWGVKTIDLSGNQTTRARTLLVDRTKPIVTVDNTNYQTTDTTPNFSGTITDPISAEVTSGPKEVSIKLEKKSGLEYSLYSAYTIQSTDATFEYTPSESLPLGTYRVSVQGKDNVGNLSDAQSFTLSIGSFIKVATPEEKQQVEEKVRELPKEEQPKAREELETQITKPLEVVGPNIFQKLVAFLVRVDQRIRDVNGHMALSIIKSCSNGMRFLLNAHANALAQTGNTISNTLTFVIRTTENFVAFVGSHMNTIASEMSKSYSLAASQVPGIGKNILLAIGNGVGTVTRGVASSANTTTTSMTKLAYDTTQGISSTASVLSKSARNLSDQIALSVAKAAFSLVSEPTRIYDVQVAILSPTSAKISWETNQPASSKVNYGLDETYPLDTQSDELTTHHEFVLTGLEPNTEYSFEVMSQGKTYVYDANRQFKTLPEEK
jgi:hypothetical protein